ncbi:hypothetical protein [Liberibacter crescens]|uniref:hypothetical protein n=1 Tax=Liberibacter crescens TaxID=1273132 RepID=UPI0005A273EE|nr:hypothetical protein [Liberibacter crescens]
MTKKPPCKKSIKTYFIRYFLVVLFFAFALVFLTEKIARIDSSNLGDFFFSLHKPAIITVLIVLVNMLIIDAIFGIAFISFIVAYPLILGLAFLSQQKQSYLPDPLLPYDILFGLQISKLVESIFFQQIWSIVIFGAGLLIFFIIFIFFIKIIWRILPRIQFIYRILCVAISIPLFTMFYYIIDLEHNSPSLVRMRDTLGIIPEVWDQASNYRRNGFIIAFALNIPISNIKQPKNYNKQSINDIVDTIFAKEQ